MLKKLFKIVVILPLLMSTQCNEDDVQSTYISNTHKVSVSPQEETISINDTIWLEGKVSSRVFDTAINDSVFTESVQNNRISVMKFIQPTQSSNCRDGIDNFELITELGELNFLANCENGEIVVNSELGADNSFYSYKIGLRALTSGDYVLSWDHSSVSNENRHAYILNEYPLESHPDQLGFDKCGDVSWRYANESDREYYFRVE
ncbi:hypothetical protein OS188_10260 [Xanthomarina sp. F1114]|uniref:hypothetical protein n=1 Tax=Xanthomarina sp. F1114 TaxID=2996019 RepID=UPI00225E4078|nr:hypothetical protein [Xanthomarina sp. F1114]MCX7548333.1 hypothetical protein [Xanthomarina sp. F1114]